MNRHEIFGLLTDIALGWIMVLVLVMTSKLAFDFLSTPNIFQKKEEVLSQKQTDEMCSAWWFDSDLKEAKKRICGK